MKTEVHRAVASVLTAMPIFIGCVTRPLAHIVLPVLQLSVRPSDGVASALPTAETAPGGVATTWLARDHRDRGTIVFLHGGGYVSGPDPGHWNWLAEVHRQLGMASAMVLYRMPPRHPQPAALNDALGAITAMHAAGDLVDGRWILAGDSAGGGLAVAAAQALRDSGGPVPTGLVLTAPWVDLTMTSPQMRATETVAQAVVRGALRQVASLYADGLPLDDPTLSPINAPLAGLPPVHLNVGTRDPFLADIRRLHDDLTTAGVRVTYVEQEGGGHVYPQSITTPEAISTIEDQVAWLRHRLDVRDPSDRTSS